MDYTKRPTNEELKSLRETYSVVELQKLFNKSESTMNRWLNAAGLTKTQDRTDIKDEYILELYQKNMLTIREIASKLGCSHDTVTKRLKKYNIVCDRTSGIKRHFERTHDEDWDEIKHSLDNGFSFTQVTTMFHMRPDVLKRLLELHSYERPSSLNNAQINAQIEFWKNNTENSHRFNNTAINYLTSISNYYSEFGILPTVYDLMDYMGKGHTTVRQAVDKYNLSPFIRYINTSQGVDRICSDLSNANIKYELNNRKILKDNDKCFEIDIYIPSLNLGIEVNPVSTHSIDCPKYGISDKYYHQNKSLLAEKSNVGLLHVYDSDLSDEYNYQKLIKYILNQHKKRVGARQCVVKKISAKESNAFLNQYHFQGSERSSAIKYGLFYNNILVSVLTIGKPRYAKSYDYEIVRYCTHPEYAISGGFKKLFNTFLNALTTNCKIMSYMDLNKRFSAQNIYEKSGFRLLDITKPDYVWVKKYGTETLSRYQTMKKDLVNQGYDSAKTEVEIMKSRGYYRVYGAGSKRYVYDYEL